MPGVRLSRADILGAVAFGWCSGLCYLLCAAPSATGRGKGAGPSHARLLQSPDLVSSQVSCQRRTLMDGKASSLLPEAGNEANQTSDTLIQL